MLSEMDFSSELFRIITIDDGRSRMLGVIFGSVLVYNALFLLLSYSQKKKEEKEKWLSFVKWGKLFPDSWEMDQQLSLLLLLLLFWSRICRCCYKGWKWNTKPGGGHASMGKHNATMKWGKAGAGEMTTILSHDDGDGLLLTKNEWVMLLYQMCMAYHHATSCINIQRKDRKTHGAWNRLCNYHTSLCLLGLFSPSFQIVW